jgi:hypothetical protein
MSVYSEGHVLHHGRYGPSTQTPARQTGAAAGQALPQRPQLAGSVCRLMQIPRQQFNPGEQATPQPPQLASLALVFTQLPLQQVPPVQGVPDPTG